MNNLEWTKDDDGTFIMETPHFRLMVRQAINCHYAKFFVWDRNNSAKDGMLGLGTAVNVAQGMKEAQNMADRFLERSASANPSVMVVDDNSAVCDIAVDMLADAGYQVAKANSGEGALQRLEQSLPPTVLVTDIYLGGGMNGLELAAAIHKLWPETGVLLVSGGDEHDICQAAGEEFLAKPFTMTQLLERVASMAARTGHLGLSTPG